MVDENTCSSCGAKIHSSYNFCTNCGCKIRNAHEIRNQDDRLTIEKPKRNTKKLLIGLAIGISIISVIAYA